MKISWIFSISSISTVLISQTVIKMDDKNIFGLRKPLPRCKHLKIYRRKFGYNHHIFVGEADESGCDLYHYSISLLPVLKICPPARIKKERLEYSSYMENKNIIKLFNWNNRDRVAIVDRDDYPENEIAENECPLVSGATGIGVGLLERVQMETSPESTGCSCHCTCSLHYTNTASNSKEGYISFTNAAVVLANGLSPYMTNSQRIGRTACNSIALLTSTYLQHNYDSKNPNNKCNIAKKSRFSSRETFIEDFKRSALNALADVSIHRRVPNHSQTNFNSEPHDIRHHSCGFPSNTTFELGNCPAGNCPADICVPEAQCWIL